jgi:hypothetical protein
VNRSQWTMTYVRAREMRRPAYEERKERSPLALVIYGLIQRQVFAAYVADSCLAHTNKLVNRLALARGPSLSPAYNQPCIRPCFQM